MKSSTAQFDECIAKLPMLLNQLCASPALQLKDIKKLPGIYYFSENGIPLYVGRTKNMKQRHGHHCHKGSKGNDAPFAFKLARELTDNMNPTYKTEGGRKQLMETKDFKDALDSSKERIRNMEVRFIEIHDPIEQTLFEVYASLALETDKKYNHFATT